MKTKKFLWQNKTIRNEFNCIFSFPNNNRSCLRKVSNVNWICVRKKFLFVKTVPTFEIYFFSFVFCFQFVFARVTHLCVVHPHTHTHTHVSYICQIHIQSQILNQCCIWKIWSKYTINRTGWTEVKNVECCWHRFWWKLNRLTECINSIFHFLVINQLFIPNSHLLFLFQLFELDSKQPQNGPKFAKQRSVIVGEKKNW